MPFVLWGKINNPFPQSKLMGKAKQLWLSDLIIIARVLYNSNSVQQSQFLSEIFRRKHDFLSFYRGKASKIFNEKWIALSKFRSGRITHTHTHTHPSHNGNDICTVYTLFKLDSLEKYFDSTFIIQIFESTRQF